MTGRTGLAIVTTALIAAVAGTRPARAQCAPDDVLCINASSGGPWDPPAPDWWGGDPWAAPWTSSNPTPPPAFDDSPGDAYAQPAVRAAANVLTIALTFPITVPSSGTTVRDALVGWAQTKSPSELATPVATGGGDAAGPVVADAMVGTTTGTAPIPTNTGDLDVPSAQGGQPPAGELDPVEPITGELVIEETDLDLPSSGIRFRLTRTYRSRIDYVGPLGPGWDHGYNQRLVSVPAVSFAAAAPPPEPTYWRLGVAAVFPHEAAVVPTETCGPALALTAGNGSSLTFYEISRSAGTIQYRSQASQLTLIGTEANGEITWTLATPRGDVRHFDAYGRLARWVDINGLGLTFTWTGTEAPVLTSAVDAEGRTVQFEYDAAGRLVRVFEPASGLEAIYTYDANGALATARRSDGRSEGYEYDVDASRTRGEWVAEGQLRQACATACAVSDHTCTAGGGCDAAFHAATEACLASCVPCNVECRWQAREQCGIACSEGLSTACGNLCAASAQQAELRAECEDAYDHLEPKFGPPPCVGCSPVPEYCYGCAPACDAAYDEAWCLGIQAGDAGGEYPLFSVSSCEQPATDCCTYGSDDCAPTSCNLGERCWETCKSAFLGWGDHLSACPPPDPTFYSHVSCLGEATHQCQDKCVSISMDGPRKRPRS